MKKLLLNNIFRNEPPERLFFRISTAGGFIAIVFFSVSVSLSQFGLFLAVSGWIALNLYQKFSKKMIESENIWKMPFRFPHLLFPASGIYISLLFSYFINTLNGEMTKHVFKTEVRDLFLIGAALWVISYSSDERGRERIFRWLKIAFWVTVTAGFFSIFSKYRLAKIPHHLIHGWEVSSLARFQHHAGTLFQDTPLEFHLYMPIGLMNTHLTYGAILSMLLPAFIFGALHVFFTSDSFRLKRTVKEFLPVLLGGAVLLLNNARSAIFGLAVVLLFGIYFYSRTLWKRKILRMIYPAAVLILLAATVIIFSPRLGERFQHLTDSLTGKSKLTDYQRVFLWQASLDIVRDDPLIGIGPGNFQSEVEKNILEYSKNKPDLWYSYFVIQRGHAHNDLLHLQAVGGVFAAFFYALFFFMLFYEVIASKIPLREHRWFWGALMVFPAGLFQCYYQDDEVLLPFWLLSGIILSYIDSGKERKSDIGEAEKN